MWRSCSKLNQIYEGQQDEEGTVMNPTFTHSAETKKDGDNPNQFRRDRNKVMVNHKRVKNKSLNFLISLNQSDNSDIRHCSKTYVLVFQICCHSRL